MKKGEHTPGPWTAQPWSVERGVVKEWVIDSKDWKDLAHVYVQDDDTVDVCELGDGNANARLIAAAPDLLDACEKVLAGGGLDVPHSDLADMLDAVIKKARGTP